MLNWFRKEILLVKKVFFDTSVIEKVMIFHSKILPNQTWEEFYVILIES